MYVDEILELEDGYVKITTYKIDSNGNKVKVCSIEKERDKPEQEVIPELPQHPQVEYISREDFDLLDITYSDTMYYITEEDGTITMKRGEE